MSPDDSYKKLGAANLNRIEQYAKRIAELMDKARGRFVNLAAGADYDKGKGDQFYFSDYPELKKATDSIVSSMASGMQQTILAGTSAEWAEGGSDAEGINEYIMEASGIKERVKELGITMKDMTGTLVSGSLNNRSSALKAFQTRRIGGMRLSSKVWDLANQNKIEAELARSIASGTSASDIAKSMQELLNEPAKLFRRVRDEFGTLKLSKNAKAYKAGEGVYRSSYKNALRLARTEINMAYRNAELESYRDMDYVVGFEVKRSTAPYDCPVCEALAGKYPKNFDWNGWHPNCRCFMIPILLTREEMDARTIARINGEEYDVTKSDNYIGDLPEGFKAWMKGNEERVGRARERGALPYFFRDNESIVVKSVLDGNGGMNVGDVGFYAFRKYRKGPDGVLEGYGSVKECRDQLSQWSAIQSLIKESTPRLDNACKGICSRFEGSLYSGLNFKSFGSAVRKADSDYNGNLFAVKDLLRTTIVGRKQDLDEIVAALRSRRELDCIRYKEQSGKAFYGYSGRLLNFDFGNGLIGEVQVNTPEMIFAKEKPANAKRILGVTLWNKIRKEKGLRGGVGHSYYEKIRSGLYHGPELDELKRLSREYYSYFQ